MVRVTNSVAARKRTKRLLKKAKGFWGDRANHHKQSRDAVIQALAFNYHHRKLRKRDFRSLWITRIGIASKACGISYSALINGLQKIGCALNRKVLSDLAICDPTAFASIVGKAKSALQA